MSWLNWKGWNNDKFCYKSTLSTNGSVIIACNINIPTQMQTHKMRQGVSSSPTKVAFAGPHYHVCKCAKCFLSFKSVTKRSQTSAYVSLHEGERFNVKVIGGYVRNAIHLPSIIMFRPTFHSAHWVSHVPWTFLQAWPNEKSRKKSYKWETLAMFVMQFCG